MTELIGHRFGRLVVIGDAGRNRHGKAKWICRCDCGTEKEFYTSNVKAGKSSSCGCTSIEHLRLISIKHGMTSTRTYKIWRNMIYRCENPNSTGFSRYGGRGIAVCKRWRLSFESFLADMGECPNGMTIERNHNNGDYKPNNCSWATQQKQSRNRRTNRLITLNHRTLSLCEWSEMLGLHRKTISGRLNRGWSVRDALITPAQRKADA